MNKLRDLPTVRQLLPIAEQLEWDEERISELARAAEKHPLTIKCDVLYLLKTTVEN